MIIENEITKIKATSISETGTKLRAVNKNVNPVMEHTIKENSPNLTLKRCFLNISAI
jgi:hypothetical protein